MEPAPVGMTAPGPFDVAVIGGGPVGLAAALELASSGRSVVLFDRAGADGGCAIGSAGFVVPSMIAPLARQGAIAEFVRATVRRRDAISIRPTFRPSDWWWFSHFARSCRPGSRTADRAVWSATAALADASAQMIGGWIERFGIDCAWQQRGVLDVYTDTGRLADAARDADAAAEFGIERHVVDGDGARELEPALTDAIVGGVFHPGDANLHPGRFLAGLATVVSSAGVDIRTGTAVTGWTRSDRTGFALESDIGRVTAAQVVIAAGVGSARFQHLLGVRVPVVGARGFSITGPASGSGPSLPLLLGERHIAVAPMGNEWRISGGFGLGSTEHPSTTAELARLISTVGERVVGDFHDAFTGRWAGLRPVAADGIPIIGPAPGCPGAFIGTGHHMGGLSFGAATGAALAALIAGQTPDVDLAPFDPIRFGGR